VRNGTQIRAQAPQRFDRDVRREIGRKLPACGPFDSCENVGRTPPVKSARDDFGRDGQANGRECL
jgi:hypothetical protein